MCCQILNTLNTRSSHTGIVSPITVNRCANVRPWITEWAPAVILFGLQNFSFLHSRIDFYLYLSIHFCVCTFSSSIQINISIKAMAITASLHQNRRLVVLVDIIIASITPLRWKNLSQQKIYVCDNKYFNFFTFISK